MAPVLINPFKSNKSLAEMNTGCMCTAGYVGCV